jgi:lipid-binding SYLF domain-containing protein
MRLKHWYLYFALVSTALIWAVPAGAAGWNPQGETEQLEAAAATVAKFKAEDSTLKVYFDKAYGYAVFPKIGTAGFIFAGAYGRGIVYQGGKPVGRASVTQASVGLTIGGETSSELLFFKDKAALDHFEGGNLEFSAEASAVIAREGAAAKASYDNSGVAVFVHVLGGAMLQASIGGQKFAYQPGLGD